MANYIKRLFEQLASPDNIARLRQQLPLEFPEAMEDSFMTYMLERSYLEDVAQNDTFRVAQERPWRGGWVKIRRLPVHPSHEASYDLLARWQGALASLHTWQSKMVFLLKRDQGHTSLYLGTTGESPAKAMQQCEAALTGNMPGIDVEETPADEIVGLVTDLSLYRHVGAVTGIPSFRSETQYSLLQTLDQLAFGLHGTHGEEADYALMVVADPIGDADTSDIIRRFQQLGSQVHTEVRQTFGETTNVGRSRDNQVSLGTLIKNAGDVASIVTRIPLAGQVLSYLVGSAFSQSRSNSIGFSRNLGRERLNKFAEYTERLTDLHAERLRDGRSTGFWNVGVYVLGQNDNDVNVLLGMLRSIYSGDRTYLEPIRVHRFAASAAESVKASLLKMCPVPLLRPDAEVDAEWHVLGRHYQTLSTPMNTKELSLVTSLPRRDVPGLRFVKSAVRFANNPGDNLGPGALAMGRIVDTGVEQRNEYRIDVDALVRHSLIVGGTGCGKTTTCKTIINRVLGQGTPLLVIEPAKDEYVRWALAQRAQGRRVNIFMPGADGADYQRLKLNPFQPAAIEGAPIDMLSRCEQFTQLVNASLPASDVLPVLIDETFYKYLKDQPFGMDFVGGEMAQLSGDYPKLDGLIETARQVMAGRGYSDEVGRGLAAALETRFNYLTRGKRGQIFNVYRSTPARTLFDEVTVVNLSKLASQRDKALVMSLLMLSLYEYRISAYTHDADYRRRAQQGRLLHMTVVEEAHNVLAKPAADTGGSGNPQQVVADLFGNMLSEIRSYGEGLMIVDQVPTRLIPDAIKNTNYKMVHRLTAPDDCEVMEAALALRPEQRGMLPLLEQGNALIAGDRDDAASWVKIFRPDINL